MSRLPKTQRLLNALTEGQKLTANQIRNRFKFASNDSVYSTIVRLRAEGYAINSALTRLPRIVQYSLAA